MNILAKIIFTTDEIVKNLVIEKLNLKKLLTSEFEVFIGKREVEEELENIVFIYCSNEYFKEAILYAKDNYIIEKILLVGFAKIVRDQDLEVGDIIIPNTFVDKNGENPIFVEYAVGENIDLKVFGLILSGVLFDMGEEKTHCGPNCDCSSENIVNDEFSGDVKDMVSYKFLRQLSVDDINMTSVIKCCINKSEDRDNKFFVDNLINIVEIML